MTISTSHNSTDKHLINKVLAGDKQAFALIIRDTEKLVAQIVFKMISNAEDRKDLAQDIYVKAYKNLTGFKFQSKLSTWIAQISYNTCLDYLRKKKLVLQNFQSEETESGDDEPDMFANYGSSGTAHGFLIQKDLSAILANAIEKLSPVYKTLVTLYHTEELSYEEIGQITGLPAGTIKSYLFRARKELKNFLLLHYKKEEL